MTRDTWHVTHDTWHMTPTHTHTPPQIWGDVKKTSPKKLHPMAQTDKQTDRQTSGHGDSMTESAQWADSVKNCEQDNYYIIVVEIFTYCAFKNWCLSQGTWYRCHSVFFYMTVLGKTECYMVLMPFCFLFLPWLLPERQVMFMWPPIRDVTE